MHVKLSSFLAWSASQGISTPLQLVVGDSYRYMSLPNGDKTLLQPSDTTDFVNLIKVPLDTCLIGKDWQELTDRLKFEKSLGEESKFAPWIDMLPTIDDFQGMPRFWSRQRREFVQLYDGGQLEARMAIDKLRFDMTDDPWALACVDSRSNFLPDSTYAMTPMLDMFNHDCEIKTAATVSKDNEFELNVSSKSILRKLEETEPTLDIKNQVFNFFRGSSTSSSNDKSQGSEVFISYGNIDNLETLCNYGFVSKNPYNIETFKVRLIGQGSFALVADADGSIDNMFNRMTLDSLRYKLATASERESLETISEDGKISDRNEEEVFALIAGELEEAVYDAKTGASEAEKLKDTTVATYLLERKKTLERALKIIEAKANFPQLF